MNTLIATTTFSLLILSGTATAPLFAPPITQDKAKTSQGFVLKAGDHDLRDIFEDAAKFLGRNYILHEADFGKGDHLRIHLQKSLNLDATGCEEVVSNLAYTRDFTIVPMDELRGLYEVIFLRGARRPLAAANAIHLDPDDVLKRSKQKIIVLTAVPLEHIDAAKAGQQLRPFFAGTGASGYGLQFGNAGSQRSLLLQGFADQVAGAIRLLRKVDQPNAQALPRSLDSQLANLNSASRKYAKTIATLEKRVHNLEAQFAEIERKKK